MTQPNQEAVRRGLLVTMFIGAAVSDATPEQRVDLQDQVLPILKDESLPAGDAMANAVKATATVMGPDWRPTGEWDAYILKLLDDRWEVGVEDAGRHTGS